MGKASRWFRGLLGLKKSDSSSSSTSQPTPQPPKPHKKRWSFVKPHQDHHIRETGPKASLDYRRPINAAPPASTPHPWGHAFSDNPNKHAIAVAAATAAAADAAVAAARAAAAVVELTHGGRSATESCPVNSASGIPGIRERAAVTIQSRFRAYLARKALRALKALVRLQALVRGYIVRKQTTDALRGLRALLRVQARACARRVCELTDAPGSTTKPSNFRYPRSCSITKRRAVRGMDKTKFVRKRLDCNRFDGLWEDQSTSLRTRSVDDDNNDKILEIDTGKPHYTSKSRSFIQYSQLSLDSDQYSHSLTTSKDSAAPKAARSLSSGEAQSFDPLKTNEDVEESSFCTADSSPRFHSASSEGASSRKGLFTSSKSYGSRSCLSGYSDCPSYMSYTESAKAKMRSVSAPKQRPHFERSQSTNRLSVYGYNGPKAQRVFTLNGHLANKAYPGSGCLDRNGMPVQADVSQFNGSHWIRY